ncbi:hypothetical protein OUZ56_029603 [Daphnia magna]|uniref:Uncharacterized protein n=1 Tax=Daphnia magna TaxID=35525 RepID=A0ABR0B7B2_9CRUS|nr:hypothetical protein OUZ56_029603 [Daphnia magna]
MAQRNGERLDVILRRNRSVAEMLSLDLLVLPPFPIVQRYGYCSMNRRGKKGRNAVCGLCAYIRVGLPFKIEDSRIMLRAALRKEKHNHFVSSYMEV